MKDFGGLMKQAQGLQAKLQDAQARLAETTIEGAAGGGLVKVALQGSGVLSSVTIDESLLAAGDTEMLGDLVVAAHADAKARLDAEQARLMQDAMGPLAGMAGAIPGLPGLMS